VLGFEGTEEKANFDALLTPLLAANPEAVFFGGIYDQIAVFIKQAREKGYDGIFLSDDGFDSPEASNIAGDAITGGGGTSTDSCRPRRPYPGTAKFQTDTRPSGAGPAVRCWGTIRWRSASAIENAALQLATRCPSAPVLPRALVDFPGITGTINFNSIGDLTSAKYFVIQVASADPAKWNENPVAETLDIAPPQ
jgi:branched-chain amino acid transport system substrate-binding protein